MLQHPIGSPTTCLLAFPPILSVVQAAQMLDRTVGALNHWPAAEKFIGTSRLRGRHRFFWRDRLNATMQGERFRLGPDGSIRITDEEIQSAFKDPEIDRAFPPFASIQTVARELKVGRSTLFRWKALGNLDGTYTDRRDGLRFLRTHFILNLFNGKIWI